MYVLHRTERAGREGTRSMGSRAIEEARLLETLQHMTLVGTLADDVVRASLAIRRGERPRDENVLSRASQLLLAAAAQLNAPFDITSTDIDHETMGVLNAFNRFEQTGGSAPNDESDSEPQRQWAERLTRLAAILDSMRRGVASPDEVDEVRVQFDAIGRITLTIANETTRPRANFSTWTPVLKS